MLVVLVASFPRVAVALERHERFGAEPTTAAIVVVALTAAATKRGLERG